MNKPDPLELGLTDLLDLVWDRRLTVSVVSIACLAIGIAAHYVVPPRYIATVMITRPSAAKFAEFTELAQADVFKYTQGSLLAEYAAYLTDRDLLAKAQSDSGISENSPKEVLVEFQQVERPATATQDGPRELNSIQFKASFGDVTLLDTFVSKALREASKALADGLRSEIQRRADAGVQTRKWLVRRAEVQIGAERQKLQAERTDSIERLTGEAQIARSFGLDRPLELQAQALTIDRVANSIAAAPIPPTSVPALPNPAGYGVAQTGSAEAAPVASGKIESRYFDGYLALEEQLKLLRSRQDDDAFIPNLRELQKQIFMFDNDPQKERVTALLLNSVLASTDAPKIVSYSDIEAKARKVFPRLSVFSVGGLVGGFFFGACWAIVSGIRRLKYQTSAQAPS